MPVFVPFIERRQLAPPSEAPRPEAPPSEAPPSEAPQAEIPQSEAPQSQAPPSEAPQSEIPQSEAPQSEAPWPGGSMENETTLETRIESLRDFDRWKENEIRDGFNPALNEYLRVLHKPVNVDTLYEAICANNWIDVKASLDENPSALTAEITSSGKTALHVAALFGHVSIVEELVKLVQPEHLKLVDASGRTSILIAAFVGVTQVAKCLVDKNSDILGIPTPEFELPVTMAFLNGHQEMGRYLYSVTPLEYLKPGKGPLGPMLLRYCLQTQCLDIVLDLLQQCEELLFASDNEGWKPIFGIATINFAFPSRSELVFWKRLIYSYINIHSTTTINHVGVHIQQEDRSKRAQGKLIWPGHGLLQRLLSYTYNCIGIKKIHDLKLLHEQAADILSLVCKHTRKSDQVSVVVEALFHAAAKGNAEFVVQASKANPEIVLAGDSSFSNIFCYAVMFRQAGVFNLIHGLRFKDAVATNKDNYGNNLLHVAAELAPASFLNRIYGPTLQMQRELQWFKEVESLVPPTIRVAQNNNGMTAEELFRESHKELMKEGEKWIKKTASSCSVVGALVITIMFSTAFTVPGGNDQNSGYPLLLKQPFFKLFIFSTILSLFSSSTSVLIFLGILASHYSEEYFLKSLPSKLILGLSSLFISITTMEIAFLSTIYLMLKHTNYSWGLLPIIILASVPIFLFVLQQFPLLLNTIFSTYAHIFSRKVELWP